MSAASPMPSGDSLEPIKRVKAIEGEVAARLAEVEERGRSELDRLRTEVESAVAQARTEAEAARDARLAAARSEADRAAADIVAGGQAKADAIRPKGPEALGRQREAILATVLGTFRPAGEK